MQYSKVLVHTSTVMTLHQLIASPNAPVTVKAAVLAFYENGFSRQTSAGSVLSVSKYTIHFKGTVCMLSLGGTVATLWDAELLPKEEPIVAKC